MDEDTDTGQNDDQTYNDLKAKGLSKSSLLLASGTAIMLLVIYVISAVALIAMAFNENATLGSPPGITAVFTTIGGLISALIVAIFTASRPGEKIGASLLPGPESFPVEIESPEDNQAQIDEQNERFIKFKEKQQLKLRAEAEKYTTRVINAYILFWILGGAGSLIVGVMLKPDSVSVLRDTGNAWLGIAVAAVAAYFGINPQPPKP